MKLISNTEVSTFNECELKHDYMYGQEIGPTNMSEPLYRGTVGHALLAEYYTKILEGESRESALAAVWSLWTRELTAVASDVNKFNIIQDLRRILSGYFDFYQVEPFKVLAVEKIYDTLLFQAIVPDTNYDVHYGAILDLVVEWTQGPEAGKIKIIDHKFVYNFKSMDELQVDAQQPKYIKVLQEQGISVNGGIFNQIRTREIKNPRFDQLFNRTPVPYQQTAIDTVWTEQKKTIKKILNIPSDSDYPTRALTTMTCKMCDFKRLCKAEMNGDSTTTMRKIEFKPRSRPLKNYVSES